MEFQVLRIIKIAVKSDVKTVLSLIKHKFKTSVTFAN